MSTVRLTVVNAISTALGTASGLKVFRNIDYALEDQKLPALVVISGADAPGETSPLGVLDQFMTIELTVLVTNAANPESAADAYEALLHAALMSASVFGGHQVSVDRVSGAWSFDLGDMAARHLAYRIGYRTSMTSLES